MSLANTLRDIAKESGLNQDEKTSLRLIAKDVAKLETMKKKLPEIQQTLADAREAVETARKQNAEIKRHLSEHLKIRCPDTKKSRDAKRAFVEKQANEACKTGNVTLRNCGEIRTGTIPVWMAFRCLYCGEFFNQSGAEEHFGMTREEFYAK